MSARATPIDRQRLITAATGLLTEHGLADLSMRRVATVLGVQPSALYWHVKDKQSLLAAVVDSLLDALELPELTGEPHADLRARALAFYQAALSIRDGAELISSVIALGTGGYLVRQSLVETRADTHLVDTVLALLLGNAAIVQQRAQARELGVTDLLDPKTDFTCMLDLLLNN